MDDITLKGVLSEGWRVAWRRRGAMAVYTLLAWFCCLIFLIPLTTWVLRALAGYGDVIVGNYTVHLWLMTPKGMTYLLLAGSLFLFTAFMQIGGLLRIAGIAGDDGISAGAALRDIIANRNTLLLFSLVLFLLCLPFVLLIGAGPGLAYLLFLTKHDINFYLSNHPPQWIATLVISGCWILVTGGVTLVLFARSMFVLPIWIEGERSVRRALRLSWEATREKLWPLVRAIVVCVVCTVALIMAVNMLLFFVAGHFLASPDISLDAVVRRLSGYLIMRVLLDLILVFLGAVWGIGVWAVCYRRYTKRGACSGERSARGADVSGLKLSHLIMPVKVVVPMALVLFVSSWGMGLWILRQNVPTKTPVVIAHRAGAALAPENTLSAIRKSVNDGFADVVEIDVNMTSDGILVIAHDKDLMKQGQDPRVIRETVYKELRKTDIGSFFSSEYKDERLGRLESFLDVANAGGMPLILEFKHCKETNLVERVIEAVREKGMSEDVTLMSLELDEVRRVQKIAPEIRVGYFASVEMGDLRKLDVDVLGAKDSMVEPGFVRDIQEKGMKVYVWTVDDPVRIVELILLGVDGIITNDPEGTEDLMRRFRELTPEQRVLLRFKKFWDILRKNWGSRGDRREEAGAME
jgi:glycerophosphoryl diester phosphodiesterase